MIFRIPSQCEGCTKNEAQVDLCRIRVYQFQVFGSQCPRELAFPEEDAEEEEPEDETAYLKPTYEKLGALLPVLQTRTGEIIDGFHRRQVDPGWPGHTLYDFDDPVKVAMARLVINVVRRQVPPGEKTQLLSDIAKLTGWTPQQIADGMGLSYSWVMKYLPDEYKQRPGAGPSAAKLNKHSVTRRVTQQPVAEVVAGAVASAGVEESRISESKPKPLLTGFTVECPKCSATLLLEHLDFPDGRSDHKIRGEKST